jgi:hypothetical protein
MVIVKKASHINENCDKIKCINEIKGAKIIWDGER